MADPSRGPRRFSLRVTLTTLVAGLLVVTVGGVVAIALVTRARTREAIVLALASEASTRVAQTLESRLQPAEAVVRETVAGLKSGRLPRDDTATLARRLGERIRFDDRFESLTFLADEGTGAGAVRMPDGALLLVHVERRADGVLERVDETLREDESVVEVRRTTEGAHAFREAPWYDVGAASDAPVWSPPYVRAFDGQVGRGCGAAVRVDGTTVGVCGVGFSFAFISESLGRVTVAETGRVFPIGWETGEVRIGPSPELLARLGPVVEAARDQVEGGMRALQGGIVIETVAHGGEDWIVAFSPQRFRENLRWINAIVVPEDEALGFLNRYLWPALLGTAVMLGLGLLLANRVARRVARPLRDIAKDLERVAAFDLTPDPSPQSRIAEVTVVGDATDRMKAGLRSFARYVPTDLVRDLLAKGQEAKLGGEQRPLSLFFSDVKGFTSVAESMDTQMLVEALGDYLDVVTRTLLQEKGTIDKYMGDGVLAFFNAPHDDADHPFSACRAALRVQEVLAARRDAWSAKGWPSFPTRIGLHTAPVIVGNLGTPDRFAYTVIGDGVNLAARLESLNKAYGTWILASEETRRAAGDAFAWREVDRTAVAGRAEGGAVYELLGEVGQVGDDALAARDRYEAALRDYLARRFADAAHGFEEALRLRPGDVAAPTLAARARDYVEHPPPEDWNGVYVQTKK